MTHVFFGLPQILSSFLMIVICCLTDCINAITLAYEKPEADVLLRPPRNIKKDRLVNGKLLLYSFCWVGTVECISSFAVSYWFLQRNGLEFADMFMKFGKVPDGFTKEEVKALVNTASSVYFVNLVIMYVPLSFNQFPVANMIIGKSSISSRLAPAPSPYSNNPHSSVPVPQTGASSLQWYSLWS